MTKEELRELENGLGRYRIASNPTSYWFCKKISENYFEYGSENFTTGKRTHPMQTAIKCLFKSGKLNL